MKQYYVQKDYLEKVEEGKEFDFLGKKIDSVCSLSTALKSADNTAISRYMSWQKNDFFAWINSVVGDVRLARDIKNLSQHANLLKCIDYRINEISLRKKGLSFSMLGSELKMYVDRIVLKVDMDVCCNCEICSSVCPQKAFKIVEGKLNLDKSKCSYCGFCVSFCPLGCVKLTYNNTDYNPSLKNRLHPALPERKQMENMSVLKLFLGKISISQKCSAGCEECVIVCPVNAIRRNNESNNELEKPVVEEETCILCGACKIACPQKIIDVQRTSINSKGDGFSKVWQDAISNLTRAEMKAVYHRNRNERKVVALIENAR
ncbi:MAG: 4Fe-4S binding protein [Candidatus Woesearchaeota archaeon]